LKSLRALEAGAYDELPAAVYARGFVKLYAEYLGVDPTVALRDFAAERARDERVTSELRLVPKMLRPFRRPRWVVRPRTTAILGGVLVGIAALSYLFFEVRGFTRAPFLDVSDPPGNIEMHGSTLVVRGKTDPTVEVRINGERTFVKSDGVFEETLGVSEGVNAIRVTATSVGGREHVVTREVLVRLPTAFVQPAAPPSNAASQGLAKPGDPFRLAVQAEGEPVWVLLRADGDVIFSGLLLQGSTQEVSGKEIQITSGDGERTKLIIEGQDRGVLSHTPGVVRDVVFTRLSPSGTVERR
jgi:cytoskeleton protein RodZ